MPEEKITTLDLNNIGSFEEFKKQWQGIPMQAKIDTIHLVGQYSAFRKRYRDDMEGFILNCIEWNEKRSESPSKDQLEIARNFPIKKRASIRALHGVGKTALAALTVLWFSLTRDIDSDWKVIVTASAWRQLTKYLYPEIHKWARKLKWNMIGRKPFNNHELLTLNLNLSTGQASAVASDNHEYIEGAHADSILVVFDEAKAIPEETWDALEGAFSTAGLDTEDHREALVLSISTPGAPEGRFFDIQSKKPSYSDWWTYHISLKDAIEQKRVSSEWAENRKKQWGENSSLYQNRVLGEFAQDEEDSIIPLAWIEAAVNRWSRAGVRSMKADQIGADPARMGGDKFCCAFRSDKTITQMKRWGKTDLMSSVGKLMRFTTANKSIKIIVDVIGVGAGVYDRLKEQGRKVYAFNAASKTKKRDRSKQLEFLNKRAASWWMMREIFEEGEIAIPDDELLVGDLASVKWESTSSGKIKVESKDDIHKRLGRSTDSADSVIMAFWKEREPGISI